VTVILFGEPYRLDDQLRDLRLVARLAEYPRYDEMGAELETIIAAIGWQELQRREGRSILIDHGWLPNWQKWEMRVGQHILDTRQRRDLETQVARHKPAREGTWSPMLMLNMACGAAICRAAGYYNGYFNDIDPEARGKPHSCRSHDA
jgi:hypothetical protein